MKTAKEFIEKIKTDLTQITKIFLGEYREFGYKTETTIKLIEEYAEYYAKEKFDKDYAHGRQDMLPVLPEGTSFADYCANPYHLPDDAWNDIVSQADVFARRMLASQSNQTVSDYKLFSDFYDHKELGVLTEHQKEVFEKASKLFIAQFQQVSSRPALIPFDLQKALAGEKVITRDGREVKQLTVFTDTKHIEHIACVIDMDILFYPESGKYMGNEPELDLFMAPKTVIKWVNVYKDWCFDTKEEAEKATDPNCELLTIAKITLEE